MYDSFIRFVRELYQTNEDIQLHIPVFTDDDKTTLCDAIDSTFVSSVSAYVGKFEQKLCDFTRSSYAVSVVNGTAALHLAMYLSGVSKKTEVITQSLSFVATGNAILYTGAAPVFVDISPDTLGMSPIALSAFLEEHGELRENGTYNRLTGRRISACVPMHTFGHPCEIDKIIDICKRWAIVVIEDAAEALGSFYHDRHCGCFGELGVLSFNGNKTITTGGGGAMLMDSSLTADRSRHLSTTAKMPHAWEFVHDKLGFNYRLPGLNAALGYSQMNSLDSLLEEKRQIAMAYRKWAHDNGFYFVIEPKNAKSNFWLNTLLMEDKQQRDAFLEATNQRGIMTRPPWNPLHTLPCFTKCLCGDLTITDDIFGRAVNIPSSPRMAYQ